jgi:hypothetical protein
MPTTKLITAIADQRRRADISPGGYRIHRPLLDKDISIGGLVG